MLIIQQSTTGYNTFETAECFPQSYILLSLHPRGVLEGDAVHIGTYEESTGAERRYRKIKYIETANGSNKADVYLFQAAHLSEGQWTYEVRACERIADWTTNDESLSAMLDTPVVDQGLCIVLTSN